MRALFITPVLPSATGNGLSMRAGMWLDALSQRFDTEVAVAALFAPHDSAEAFTTELARSTTMLRGRLPQTPGVPRPVPVLDDTSAALLSERMRAADVVVVFRLYLAGLAEEARDLGVPVVLDLDDLDWVREERLGDHDEAEAYRRYAEGAFPSITVVTTASAADAQTIAHMHPSLVCRHVPNGIRPPDEQPDDSRQPDVDLLFVATLGYPPNVQAATWLVQEVMPRLPGVTTAIVGAAPVPQVQRLAARDVTIAADVAEVSSWYRRARLCVVPIHSGSGTRTKIPEAWAHRRPVVTTTTGAEGLDVAGAAVIADDAETFARACAALLADAEQSQALARAGHERYRAAHTHDHAMSHADHAIDLALNTAGRTLPARRVRP